jgi:3-oxoadipate enol-lactonase
MAHLTLPDGQVLHYEDDDFTDPWSRKPLLFLQHGNGRSGRFWWRCMPGLLPYFRVIRPDMRGVGQSSRPADLVAGITIEQCVDDLVRLIGHCAGGAPVFFCGESMGGILGMVLAATRPDLVRALCLVATPVYINQNMKDRYALGYPSRLDAMRGMGLEQWVRVTSKDARLPHEQEPELFEWYVQEYAKGDPEVLIRYSDLVNGANAVDILPAITCPTRAIFPSNGPITDRTQEDLLLQGIRQVDIAHLPSDYHMIHLSHPRECAELIAGFFRDRG